MCLVGSDMGNHVEYDVLFTFLDHFCTVGDDALLVQLQNVLARDK